MKTDYPKPTRPLSVSEIVRLIREHPADIESTNECANPAGDSSTDRTVGGYIWVWPAHALLSNDGRLIGGERNRYPGLIGAWRLRRAIRHWRERELMSPHDRHRHRGLRFKILPS